MCLFSYFILFSFVLADIWQKLKLLYQSAWSGTSPPSPYLTCFYLVLMLHINILLSFHSRHIFESIIFNVEDNVWFIFGGMYINFYIFVLFCLVVLKKKKNFLAVYVLSLLYYSCLKNFIAFMLNSLHMHVATQTQLVVEG